MPISEFEQCRYDKLLKSSAKNRDRRHISMTN